MTDVEILTLYAELGDSRGYVDPIEFARAVIAKILAAQVP